MTTVQQLAAIPGTLTAQHGADAEDADAAIHACRLALESLTPGQRRRLAATEGSDGHAPTLVPRYVMLAIVDALGHTYLPDPDEDDTP